MHDIAQTVLAERVLPAIKRLLDSYSTPVGTVFSPPEYNSKKRYIGLRNRFDCVLSRNCLI